MAYGYYSAINESSTHLVDIVKLGENLSKVSKDKSKVNTVYIEMNYGGGVNYRMNNNNTLSIIVMDSKYSAGRVFSDEDDAYFAPYYLPGELLAHELLSHGMLKGKYDVNKEHVTGVQVSNLFTRAQGKNYYRNGFFHMIRVKLSKNVATAVPSYLQVPENLKK